MKRNQWPDSTGIGGRLAPEYAYQWLPGTAPFFLSLGQYLAIQRYPFFHSAASIFLRRFNPSISSPSILIQRRNLMAIIWMFVLCWFGLFVHCFANGRRTASRLPERAACLMKLSECLALAGEKEFSAILPLRRVHGIGRALSHEPLPPVG
jgi:hypothetical protein